MTLRPKPDFSLDGIIHERARLAVLAYLEGSSSVRVPFTELRERLDLTAGNLSVQLRTLEQAGYVEIDKRIIGRKSMTTVSLAAQGQEALQNYIAKMEAILRSLKSQPTQL